VLGIYRYWHQDLVLPKKAARFPAVINQDEVLACYPNAGTSCAWFRRWIGFDLGVTGRGGKLRASRTRPFQPDRISLERFVFTKHG